MDGEEDQEGGQDPIRGTSPGDSTSEATLSDRTGGRLRRRSAGFSWQATRDEPVALPTPGSDEGEDSGYLVSALTAMTQRFEVLADATRAMRADMDKSLAEIAGAVTSGQEQIRRDVDDAVARSLETARSDLSARFQDDLGSLTATLSDALAQVAAHLERLSVGYDDNREAVDNATETLKGTSSRLDQLVSQGLPGQVSTASEPGELRASRKEGSALAPSELTALTAAFTRVEILVETLARRIG